MKGVLNAQEFEWIIWSGRNGERENIKIVLPVRLTDAETPGAATLWGTQVIKKERINSIIRNTLEKINTHKTV